jgi:cobalt-zinc-cadmium efflux system membrane fusion protein
LAELRAAKSLADKRVARLKELSDTVPRKDIEAAESEAASLAERMAAVGGGLATREALVAPVSGVIASAHVVAGQVVDARELLFEIIDPSRLRIEALAFEPSLAANVGSATLAVGDQRVPLEFLGAGAQPARASAAAGLPRPGCGPEQPGRRTAGARVRADQGEGQGHRGPGRVADEEPGQPDRRLGQDRAGTLRASQVTTEALDGVNVVGHVGPEGRRPVATQGATLINQVR